MVFSYWIQKIMEHSVLYLYVAYIFQFLVKKRTDKDTILVWHIVKSLIKISWNGWS